MQKIKLTDGCPNGCKYCYEPYIPIMYHDMPKIIDKNIQILDMNFLSNPRAEEYIVKLGSMNCKTELVCGIDYRLLYEELAFLLKQFGFIKIRWAWDYGFSQQKKHNKVWRMLTKAGYRKEELSVFILVNWFIPFTECCMKLDLLKVWNVKVNDCCWDGGYPKNEIDYNKNPRFNGKRIWKYHEIKKFRKMSRKHNIMVRFKIDAEVK